MFRFLKKSVLKLLDRTVYFMNDFGMVPVASVITGISFVFTFHKGSVAIIRSLYVTIFSASLLITFLSPEAAASIKFPFNHHGLRCPVYCQGWFCQFSLVDFIMWLPYLIDLF